MICLNVNATAGTALSIQHRHSQPRAISATAAIIVRRRRSWSVSPFPGLFGLLIVVILPSLLACQILAGGQCHDRYDGSVLKQVEDPDGVLWPVIGEYPPVTVLGRTIVEGGICAVSVEAGHTIFHGSRMVDKPNYPKDESVRFWLHPETGEPVKMDVWGPQKGMLPIDSVKYEWY